MIGQIKNGMIMMVKGILGITIAIAMSVIGLIVTICVVSMLAIAVFINVIAKIFDMNKTGDLCEEVIEKVVDYLEDKWD